MSDLAARRLEEKDRRRAEILDAAEAVAAESGIDALTMDQVARRARISRALLYVYFQDRSDLHLGLCERGLALLTTRFEHAARRQPTGLTQIRAIGAAYVAFAQKFPVYFEALARFHASDTDPDQAGNIAQCMAAGERVQQIMIGALEAGQRDGSVSVAAGNPAAIAMTLWGFMYGVIQLSATKSVVLARYGLSGRQLFEQALHLATRSLAEADA